MNRKRILCFLTALMLLLLCGCGSPESIAQAQTPLGLGLFSKKNTAPEPEPEQQQEEVRGPYVAPPFAASAYHAGLAKGTADARIDLSAVAEGYVAVAAVAANRLKFQVVKDDIVYNYDIASNGTPSIFPLQSGNGTYRFRVMENVVDSKYAEIYSATREVTLIDEFQPFLRPNDDVPYTSDSLCVKKAQELAATAGDELGLVNAVFQFVCANVTYDREKAMAVTSGYMPKPDETMQTGKGICFDYAALAGAMLRSQGIPSKEIFGDVAPDGVYHAWNMFYTESNGWVTVSYEVRADSWNRLEDILFRLSRYYAEQKTISEKLKNAVIYPAAMLVLIIAVSAVMLVMVLPAFTDVYNNLTGSLAAPSFSYVRWSYALCWIALVAMVLLAAALIAGLVLWNRGKRGAVERVLRRNKLCASILESMGKFRFTAALATFLASGEMQDEAVLNSLPMTDCESVEQKLRQCVLRMEEGHSIAQAAYDEELFEPVYGRMLLAGERSGNLENVLRRLTELQEENCALPDEGGNARVTKDGVEAGYDLDMAPDSTGTPALLLRIGWEPEGGLARSRIAVYRGGEGGSRSSRWIRRSISGR